MEFGMRAKDIDDDLFPAVAQAMTSDSEFWVVLFRSIQLPRFFLQVLLVAISKPASDEILAVVFEKEIVKFVTDKPSEFFAHFCSEIVKPNLAFFASRIKFLAPPLTVAISTGDEKMGELVLGVVGDLQALEIGTANAQALLRPLCSHTRKCSIKLILALLDRVQEFAPVLDDSGRALYELVASKGPQKPETQNLVTAVIRKKLLLSLPKSESADALGDVLLETLKLFSASRPRGHQGEILHAWRSTIVDSLARMRALEDEDFGTCFAKCQEVLVTLAAACYGDVRDAVEACVARGTKVKNMT
jgi:hypothetical protein